MRFIGRDGKRPTVQKKHREYMMNDQELEKELNRNLIWGYVFIAVVLVLGYGFEMIKDERTILYVAGISMVTLIPMLFCVWRYQKNPYGRNLRYCIISCYFTTYLVVLFTSHSLMVFTYILPLLAFFVLYHQPHLIAFTGVATMIVNIAYVVTRYLNDDLTVKNSADVEIEFLVLVLCFAGCYISTRMYDRVHTQNSEYMTELDARNRQIQDMTLQTIETIANTIDAKDMYTKGHSRRVSIYAKHIAMELGLSEEKISDIVYIGLLHDIGKIAVPDSILNKPGKLTDSEYEQMKEHTVKGGEIFKDITMVPGLDYGARYHHERFDGKGYPEGLKGEQIPLEARIICLADSFDAMTSTRVYRKKLAMDVVISEIKRCRGTQFDPVITDAFLRYLNREDYKKEIDELSDGYDKAAGIEVLKQYMKGQAKQIAENAEKDELTKVYNRSAGERYIASAVKNQLGCILLVNLDNMREINNRFGFRRGDYYLQQVAHLLSGLDENIQIARFGGDEFLCFLPGLTDKDDISRKIDGLMDEVRGMDKIDPFIIDMTLSIGVSIHDQMEQNMQALLLLADKALYHVKQTSKNGYYFYEESDHIKESFSKAELARFIEQLRKKDNFSDSSLLGKDDLERISKFIKDVEEDGKTEDVNLIMFTAKPEKDDIAVENRNVAMRFVDQAIKSIVRDDNAMVRYSSLQRIVIASGDESDLDQITKDIVDLFNDSYTKQDHVLSVIREKVNK